MSIMPVSNGSNGGRDDRGRFTPGNQFGQGNPAARRMHALRQTVLDSLTEDDVRQVTRKLLELALAGDTTAIRLVLEYAVGRPVQAIELSGPDQEPLQVDLTCLSSGELEVLGQIAEQLAEARAANPR